MLYGVIPAVLFSIRASRAWAEDVAGPADAGTDAAMACSTAKDDLATLEDEKQATCDKAVDGVLSYTPVWLVANVATGGHKMDEEHNKKIDERMAEIKAACGDAIAPDPAME